MPNQKRIPKILTNFEIVCCFTDDPCQWCKICKLCNKIEHFCDCPVFCFQCKGYWRPISQYPYHHCKPHL